MQLTMTSVHHSAGRSAGQKPRNSSGEAVHCIHCFQAVGRETAKTSRTKLLARHLCPEQDLAKRPGAPPPYN